MGIAQVVFHYIRNDLLLLPLLLLVMIRIFMDMQYVTTGDAYKGGCIEAKFQINNHRDILLTLSLISVF